jgi:hypothetical protein
LIGGSFPFSPFLKGDFGQPCCLAGPFELREPYKLEYRYLKKMVHDGKRLQLWNIIPPSIYTPQEHETYVKKLTENLTSKDRWTRIFARMQVIRLGRYKDESQSTRLRLRSSSRAAPL